MPYIYKYVDTADSKVKYVGIIKRDSNFPKRFYQHKRDDWYDGHAWEIWYTSVPTSTDAEMLEAHFISVYMTDEYYNKAKSDWGECSFLNMELINNLQWFKYTDALLVDEDLPARAMSLELKLRGLQDELDKAQTEVQEVGKAIGKAQDAIIKCWYRHRLIEIPYGKTNMSDAYNDFKQFINEPVIDWLSESDFTNFLASYWKVGGSVRTDGKNKYLYGYKLTNHITPSDKEWFKERDKYASDVIEKIFSDKAVA